MITQELVDSNLSCAQENGYFNDLNEWTVEEIVTDLLAYSVDCENATEEDLTPLVRAWYEARKLGDGETGNAPDC